ncbi:MAG: hypothetical protein ABIC91_05810 [Nanoarchaeota archaeon]|nr:hypothetical protein [Nanoarchaeota archaeon]MBU1030817.1 hypothetical protein [Nanoarchaeota archaeon]MBU1850171.1 hypothetical protein [Nanoarchaeota archaeon]
MNDITNKLTTEEKKAHIQSVEDELERKELSTICKITMVGLAVSIAVSSSIPIIGLVATTTIGYGAIITMCYTRIKKSVKYKKEIKQTKKNLEQLYK